MKKLLISVLISTTLAIVISGCAIAGIGGIEDIFGKVGSITDVFYD